jgi:hypothetical protein
LSTPEWKIIPWLEIPKDPKDNLLDLLLDMPGLLEDLDKMASCVDRIEKDRLRQDLVARCWVYDTQLRTWLAATSPSTGDCAQVYRQPEIDHVSYEDISLTYAFQTFWTACLLLYTTLRLASDPQATLPEYTDPQIYVHNITVTTPTLLNPSSGIYGQYIMILPFALALKYAESMAKQQDMLMKVTEGPQGEVVKGFLHRLDFLQNTR